MPETEAWTIGRLLQWTTAYLRDRGSQTPRLDAELLLAEACGCQRIDLYTRFDQLPEEGRRRAFREFVRRRAEGTPVAYLLGRREFYSLSFRVTPDVLIPRPETEFVVIRALDLARGRPAEGPLDIADVGTGSGILAICLAKELPTASVLAIDISAAALAVARANAADHGVADRIELLQSDLFALAPGERRFDFIVSNPPYVSSEEMNQLAPDVRGHEPRAALEAGPSGMEVINRLVAQAAPRLRPGGHLLMEISPQLERAVLALVGSDGRYEAANVIKDLAGHSRVVEARRTGSAP
jgi:release factor glutamine methyltransferase